MILGPLIDYFLLLIILINCMFQFAAPEKNNEIKADTTLEK